MVEISMTQMVFSWPFNNYDTAKTRILNLLPLSPFVTNFLPPPAHLGLNSGLRKTLVNSPAYITALKLPKFLGDLEAIHKWPYK